MQTRMQKLADLGLDVAITELDIRIQTPTTTAKLQQQANEAQAGILNLQASAQGTPALEVRLNGKSLQPCEHASCHLIHKRSSTPSKLAEFPCCKNSCWQ